MLGFISKPTILSFAINDAAPSTSQRTVRLTSIDIYDPSTNTCVVSSTRLPVADAVAAWPGVDGLIYAASGPSAGQRPSYLWAYDIAGTLEDVGFDFSFTPV